MEHFLNWQSTVCLPTRQSRIISTTFTAQCCSALSLKPTASSSSSCPAFCGNLQKEAKHHSSKKQKERIKHIYLLSHHPQPACKGRDTKFSICLLLLFFSNHKPSLLAAVVCFFSSFALIERVMHWARMICIFKSDWGYLQGVLLDFGVIVSPFPSAFFNVGMDICSSSTDLTVPLISLDSQSPALRDNKTRTSVVRPLPSLTMCTSQKSPLFLQLIISSIHTRQRVCGSASLQRAIYHLSQEQKVKNICAGDNHILCAFKVFYQ